jgi:protoporphyrinogen oxidase
MDTFDVAILGGGLSGISCAAVLQEKNMGCVVLEKEAIVGGLTRTRQVNGFTFDCHGGKVFNTKNGRVRDWVFSHLPSSEWQFSPRIAKIWYKGQIISYPFELALSELPPEEATDCIAGIFERTGEEPTSFGDWLKWNFGSPVAEKYLLPYNKKIWRRDLAHMSAHWVRGKMPIPNAREVLYAALSKDVSEKKMVHSSYYYPKKDGINGFINCLTKNLKNLETSSPLVSLEQRNGRWVINGDIQANKVISTLPIPELFKAFKEIPAVVAQAISRLDYNSITAIFCEQTKARQITWSWLYLPGDDLPAHRIVYQGSLAPANCPEGRFAATYEITGLHSPEAVIEPFKNEDIPDELRALNILDFEHTQYAYPIFHLNYLEDIQTIQSWLNNQGLLSCGRFAEWKYLNMDDCIGHALEITDTLLR